jgi:hypothetical protein
MFRKTEVPQQMYRITYCDHGKDTFTHFASSYDMMIRWVELNQTRIRQILCIERYVILDSTDGKCAECGYIPESNVAIDAY